MIFQQITLVAIHTSHIEGAPPNHPRGALTGQIDALLNMYLNQNGMHLPLNSTFWQPNDPRLYAAKWGARITPSCPQTWVVDFEAARYPQRIQKCQCNGQGTTCLSSNGIPSCQEIRKTKLVYRFYGIDSAGNPVWRQEYFTVAVGCTCSV